MKCSVALDEENEPLAVFIFNVPDEEDTVEIYLGEMALGALVMAAQEMMMRAAVMREMVSAFPDLREHILATLAVRWHDRGGRNGDGP
jgi:hypothetical protein